MEMTPHPQCMPDEYKIRVSPVLAYRKYYVNDKKDIAKWEKGRDAPYWYTNPRVIDYAIGDLNLDYVA
jgi:hypothetical protein